MIDFAVDRFIEGLLERELQFVDFFFQFWELLLIWRNGLYFFQKTLLISFEEGFQKVRLDVFIFKRDLEMLWEAVIVFFYIHQTNYNLE